MEFYINLKVNFRGAARSFLLSGPESRAWEAVEATVSPAEPELEQSQNHNQNLQHHNQN